MTSDDDIRVMIIDDHEVARRGTAGVADRMNGLIAVAGAGSAQEVIHRGELVHPDIALVDLRLPDGMEIDITRRLTEAVPDTKYTVSTSFDDDETFAEAQVAGAKAYLLKSVRGAEITENIKAVASGRVLLDEWAVSRRRADHADPIANLTPSERRVSEFVGDGLPNREIGDRLGVAEKTAKNYITSFLSKTGFQRRT